MAEAHRTSVSVADEASVHGSSFNPSQSDYDALKQELIDVKATLQSLMKTIEDMREARAETVSFVLSQPYRRLPPSICLCSRGTVPVNLSSAALSRSSLLPVV